MKIRCLGLLLIISLALAAVAYGSACLPSFTYNVTGTRLRYVVASGGTGTACSSGVPCTLGQALSTLTAGDTLILGSGTYQLNLITQNGIFVNAVNNVTIRGVDNTSCETTILDGNGMDNTPSGSNPSGAADGVNYGIWSDSANTTIAHLTIRNTYIDAIALNNGAMNPVIHQVRMQNTGEQIMKVNPSNIDNGILEDSVLEYTAGPPTTDHGAGIGYWNGISAHAADNWIVRRNLFANLHNPDTVQDSYKFNPALLIWSCSNTWLVERNTFYNTDVAIAPGSLLTPACGTYDAQNVTIRNNVIVQATGFFSGTRQSLSDGQINPWNSANTKIYHNTILTHGNSTHAIQVRWLTSPISDIQNNLTDDTINLRDGASATNTGNFTSAVDAWFIAPQTGDVHLNDVAGTQANVINQAPTLAVVTNDFDGVSRPQGAGYDRGAIEFTGGAFDFTLSLSTPTLVVGRALSGQVTLTATISGAPTEAITWSSNGAGTGTTVGFGPGCAPTCAVTVTIQTQVSSALGIDTITLTGTSATKTKQINLDVNVLQTVGPGCTILWDVVTQNQDGSAITDLDHYNVYRRTSGSYGQPCGGDHRAHGANNLQRHGINHCRSALCPSHGGGHRERARVRGINGDGPLV